jgi:hypothetical protein
MQKKRNQEGVTVVEYAINANMIAYSTTVTPFVFFFFRMKSPYDLKPH